MAKITNTGQEVSDHVIARLLNRLGGAWTWKKLPDNRTVQYCSEDGEHIATFVYDNAACTYEATFHVDLPDDY